MKNNTVLINQLHSIAMYLFKVSEKGNIATPHLFIQDDTTLEIQNKAYRACTALSDLHRLLKELNDEADEPSLASKTWNVTTP